MVLISQPVGADHPALIAGAFTSSAQRFSRELTRLHVSRQMRGRVGASGLIDQTHLVYDDIGSQDRERERRIALTQSLVKRVDGFLGSARLGRVERHEHN